MVKDLIHSEFEAEVLKSEIPVLVDFWSKDCMPCKMIASLIDEMSVEFEGELKVCKADVDTQFEFAIDFGITAVPMLIFFRNGKEISRSVGMIGKMDLISKIEKAIA